MLIGYDVIDGEAFSNFSPPVVSIKHIQLSNMVSDELHVQSTIDDSGSTKETWTLGTILLATFNGDLEAGNIQLRENPIQILRVKRRNLKKQNFVALSEIDFDPNPTQLVYDDYTASSDEEYEYIVAPVDSSGIEGMMTATYINPKFDGWWIVDPERPDEYNFQFLYNLDDVSITVDEDRTEISTFSKYPKVYYGQKYARRGSLSGLFLPEGYNVREQYEKLIAMINAHKPYILKDGFGRNFKVDISTPQETINSRLVGVSKVQVNWVEVGEVID